TGGIGHISSSSITSFPGGKLRDLHHHDCEWRKPVPYNDPAEWSVYPDERLRQDIPEHCNLPVLLDRGSSSRRGGFAHAGNIVPRDHAGKSRRTDYSCAQNRTCPGNAENPD